MQLKIKGIVVEPTMPSLDTLTMGLRNGAIAQLGEQNFAGSKAYCKRCLSKEVYDELCKRASSCFDGLAMMITAHAAGGRSADSLEIVQLDPETDEMPEEMADAFMKNTEKSEGLYKEDDPRRALYAISFIVHDEKRFLILRFPHEAEVDNFKRQKGSFEAAQTLVQKITVWGDAASIEKVAPAAYIFIAKFATAQAGDWSIELLGE